jgi:hypothetical protein
LLSAIGPIPALPAIRFIATACLLALTATPTFAKPPTLDRLFPAGAQRGRTVEVTAEGSFDPWPVSAWVQGRGIEVRPAEAKGKLTVVVAADAPAGFAWIRLFNKEGASELRPFLIGTLPEVVEVEPNDAPSAPQRIETLPATINGRLAKAGDVDGFAVDLRAGQTLVAALRGHEGLGSPMDAILQIARPDGIVLGQGDDSAGLDPRLVFEVPSDGRYIVRAFAFPSEPSSTIRFAGGDAYLYRLTLTVGPFADHAVPLAVPKDHLGWVGVAGWNLPDEIRTLPVTIIDPDSGRGQADHPRLAAPVEVQIVPHSVSLEQFMLTPATLQLLTPPVSLIGRLGMAGERDVYRFPAEKDRVIVVRVVSRSLGFPLDPVLRVFDPEGKLVAELDDDRSGRDPEIRLAPRSSGEYRAEVRDLNGRAGSRCVYRLDLLPATPDFRLTIPGDRFTLSSDKPLEIAVTIDRRDNFAEPVTLTVHGLPEGVEVPAVTSRSGENFQKATLRLTSKNAPDPDWSGPIRIVGESGTPATARPAEAPIGTFGTTAAPWLTVLAPAKAEAGPAKPADPAGVKP